MLGPIDLLYKRGHLMPDKVDKLVLLADLASRTESLERRERIIRRLSQTANEIIVPKFDAGKLRDALTESCVERPDFGDPVVIDTKQGVVHINGSFDLGALAYKYYAKTGVLLEAGDGIDH